MKLYRSLVGNSHQAATFPGANIEKLRGRKGVGKRGAKKEKGKHTVRGGIKKNKKKTR